MPRTTIRSEDVTDLQIKTADIDALAVTNAKVADDAVGVAELSATGTASATTYLRGDNAWTEIETGTAWQAVVTAATLTAVAGRGYPIDTSSNACTVTLPAAASLGDTIEFMDYKRYWGNNNVTLETNGLNYQGNEDPNPVYTTAGESLRIVYVDATQGWVPVFDGAVALETPQITDIEWLVIAGGAGGGIGQNSANMRSGGGGGAGGYRNSYASEASGGGNTTETKITGIASGIVLTATIGAGGVGKSGEDQLGAPGVDTSLIGTGVSITSAGGGGGSVNPYNGLNGGSGGGGGATNGTQPGGLGTSNQGYNGGAGKSNTAGGGGGAAAVGADASGSNAGGAGGAGLNNTITGSSVGRGGGGGGGGNSPSAPATHGGAAGGTSSVDPSPATANTGGGGGGAGENNFDSGAGGSGVVILRMNTNRYSGTITGSPTVTTDGSSTIVTFTGTGTYTT